MEHDPIVLTVEDSFVLVGRGVVVTPGLESDRLPNWTRLNIDLVDSLGNTRRVMGRFGLEHLALIGKGSKWQGMILLDEGVGRVEPGTRLTARVAESLMADAITAPSGNDRARLTQLWETFRGLKFPSIRFAEEVLGEEAYDVVDAEGYLAGLVDTYVNSARIRVAAINFDPRAHRRALDRLGSANTGEVGAFIQYAVLVGELAVTLSRVSGIPLRAQ